MNAKSQESRNSARSDGENAKLPCEDGSLIGQRKSAVSQEIDEDQSLIEPEDQSSQGQRKSKFTQAEGVVVLRNHNGKDYARNLNYAQVGSKPCRSVSQGVA